MLDTPQYKQLDVEYYGCFGVPATTKKLHRDVEFLAETLPPCLNIFMAVTKLSFTFSQSLTLVFKSDIIYERLLSLSFSASFSSFNSKFSLWSLFCRDTYSCLSISLELFISLDRALILQLIS